ncbi:hypothetical protein OUZ56_017618 [Daphnia magna]|uniref:Uncharacterized protein n=1 Tax=Daphnia magna TaxID=35525 RepID=A0ABR0AT89_9CRUS|nr:hypothetical protein OUZ56_017618 [Daphnia magna]
MKKNFYPALWLTYFVAPTPKPNLLEAPKKSSCTKPQSLGQLNVVYNKDNKYADITITRPSATSMAAANGAMPSLTSP